MPCTKCWSCSVWGEAELTSIPRYVDVHVCMCTCRYTHCSIVYGLELCQCKDAYMYMYMYCAFELYSV